jgi:hypothetical protein
MKKAHILILSRYFFFSVWMRFRTGGRRCCGTLYWTCFRKRCRWSKWSRIVSTRLWSRSSLMSPDVDTALYFRRKSGSRFPGRSARQREAGCVWGWFRPLSFLQKTNIIKIECRQTTYVSPPFSLSPIPLFVFDGRRVGFSWLWGEKGWRWKDVGPSWFAGLCSCITLLFVSGYDDK